MVRKYELTDETMEFQGRILHRIKAVRDIKTDRLFYRDKILKDELGGWVESEDNLCHSGNCWIFDNGIVCDRAIVTDNGSVENDAVVYGNATVDCDGAVIDWAHVFGNANITDSATVAGRAQVFGYSSIIDHAVIDDTSHVFGNAIVGERARIRENSWVYGEAHIFSGEIRGDATLFGDVKIMPDCDAVITSNAVICGRTCIDISCKLKKDAFVNNDTAFFVAGPLGSRADYTTFYKSKRGEIMVSCGCFNDTLCVFREAVLERHSSHLYHLESYLMAANLAEKVIR